MRKDCGLLTIDIKPYRFMLVWIVLVVSAGIIISSYLPNMLAADFRGTDAPLLAVMTELLSRRSFFLLCTAVMPLVSSDTVFHEYSSGFILFICQRVSKREYCRMRIQSLTLSSGCTSLAVGAGVLIGIICILKKAGVTLVSGDWKTVIILLQVLLVMFFAGAVFSLIGVAASLAFHSRLTAITFPFVFFYVTAFFQEHYYSKLTGLNFRYVIFPHMLSVWVCLLLDVGLTFMMAAITRIIILYRLRDL